MLSTPAHYLQHVTGRQLLNSIVYLPQLIKRPIIIVIGGLSEGGFLDHKHRKYFLQELMCPTWV